MRIDINAQTSLSEDQKIEQQAVWRKHGIFQYEDDGLDTLDIEKVKLNVDEMRMKFGEVEQIWPLTFTNYSTFTSTHINKLKRLTQEIIDFCKLKNYGNVHRKYFNGKDGYAIICKPTETSMEKDATKRLKNAGAHTQKAWVNITDNKLDMNATNYLVNNVISRLPTHTKKLDFSLEYFKSGIEIVQDQVRLADVNNPSVAGFIGVGEAPDEFNKKLKDAKEMLERSWRMVDNLEQKQLTQKDVENIKSSGIEVVEDDI